MFNIKSVQRDNFEKGGEIYIREGKKKRVDERTVTFLERNSYTMCYF